MLSHVIDKLKIWVYNDDMTRLSHGGDTIPNKTFFNLEEEKRNRIVECAIDEFASRSYDDAKLSNIIKNAQIPRGSLYQYFEDKLDLYLYILDLGKKKKLEYIEQHLSNPQDLPFFELFRSMYTSGVKFAVENPRLVKVFVRLIASKGEIYDQVFSDSLDIAMDLYADMIERDKKLGRIRKEINTRTFAKLVVDMTLININVFTNDAGENDIDFDEMSERITQVMDIIEKGVSTGETSV